MPVRQLSVRLVRYKPVAQKNKKHGAVVASCLSKQFQVLKTRVIHGEPCSELQCRSASSSYGWVGVSVRDQRLSQPQFNAQRRKPSLLATHLHCSQPQRNWELLKRRLQGVAPRWLRARRSTQEAANTHPITDCSDELVFDTCV